MRTIAPPLFTALLCALQTTAYAQQQQSQPPPSIAIQFDGIDDRVTIGASPLFAIADALTLEVWVKADPAQTCAHPRLINKFNQAENRGYSLYLDNGRIAMEVRDVKGKRFRVIGSAINDGRWHHVAGTFTGTSLRIHLDGVQDGEITFERTTIATSGNHLRIGYDGGSEQEPFKGTLDEVRVWRTVRGPEEIKANKDQCLAGTEQGLVGYWRFNEASGTLASDYAGKGNTGRLENDAARVAGKIPCTVNASRDALIAGQQIGNMLKGNKGKGEIAGQDIPPGTPVSGLKGWWPFANHVQDHGGNSNHGAEKRTKPTPDRWNNTDGALQLSAKSELSIPPSASLAVSGAFSINLWIKAEAQQKGFILDRSMCPAGRDWSIYWDNGGVTVRFHTAGHEAFLHAAKLPVNTWQMVTLVRETGDAGRISLYIDGRLAEGKPMDNELFQNLDRPIQVGDRLCDPDAAPNFSGGIDDIAIWDRPLTVDEIAGLPGPKLVEAEEKPVSTSTAATSTGNGALSPLPAALFSPVQLITAHFGSAPKGSPPALRWKPSATDYKKFVDVPFATEVQPVITTLDTILRPSEDMALVFFRTTQLYDSEEERWGWLMEGWLSLAVYMKGAEGWKAGNFNKWFAKQGMYDLGFGLEPRKPALLETGRTGRAVKIVSSDGEPMMHTTTHRLYRLPDLKEAMSIITMEFEEDRSGPDGPVPSGTSQAYRFVPSKNDWYDVEVFKGDEAGINLEWIGPESTPSAYFVWSTSAGKYISGKAPARKP